MIKYGYIKIDTIRPGFVSVVVNRPDKDDPNQKHYVSFAFCSPKDSFVKSKGRRIAEGRLTKMLTAESGDLEHHKCVMVNLRGSIQDVIQAALNRAIQNGMAPSWVVRAQRRGQISYGLSSQTRR
jgi:hypothetical protein